MRAWCGVTILALFASTSAAGEQARSAPGGTGRESVKALLQQARAESGAGNAAGALESLRRARALAPNAEDVLGAYAQVALAAGLPIQAINVLDPLTRMCPGVAQYHYLLGVAYLQAGGLENATDALQEANRLEPARSRTLTALGLALNSRKLHAEAEPLLRRALELEPDHVDVLAALAEAEEALGQEQAAEQHAARAMTVAPGHPMANFVIGVVRMKQERYADARDALLRAIAAQPTLAKAHYQISLAYARLGDAASAQKHVELYKQKMREMEDALRKLRADTGIPVDAARGIPPGARP